MSDDARSGVTRPDWTEVADGFARNWFDIELDDAALRQHRATLAGWREGVARAGEETRAEDEPASFLAAVAAGAHDTAPAGTPPAPQPERDAELLDLDLTEIAALLANRRVSSEEVTRVSLERLERAHGAFNLSVGIDGDAALAAARAADTALARGRQAPLLGVPLAHKDLLYRAGRPVDAGAKLRAGHVPDRTATVLSRLDEAGALDLARLHMTEFAFDPTGQNGHYGPCLNPWDTARLPGGSSSGSGAVVAARAVYAALGSDTGGSVRIPATLCGVTGLKTSYGRVSRAGSVPLSFSCDTIGPLARSARDCARLLSVIAGRDDADPTTSLHPAGDYEAGIADSIEGLRIGVPQSFFREGLPAGIAAALDASLAVFSAMGASIREVPDFDYAELNVLASLMIRAEALATNAKWVRDTPELYSPAIREKFEEGVAIPASVYIRAQSTRGPRLRQYLSSVMADVDVLHAPVSPIPAPRLDTVAGGGDAERRVMADLTRLTRPINYLGLPALALPCGFVEEGGVRLPTAFQLIGRPYAEALLLRAGHAYQQCTDWHRQTPPRV